MTTDTTTLQQRLAEAEDKLHQLLMGESVVTVWNGTRRVEFTPASTDRLRSYIRELKGQLGQSQPRGGVIYVR